MAQHNPFIDAILAGREPNVMDFLRGPQSSATPGINPAAPPIPRPAQAKPKSGIEGLLNNKFLLNLLAQSGSSFTPGLSPIGAIGRAGLATQQQNQQQNQFDIQKKLLESRIGLGGAQADLARARTATEINPTIDLGQFNKLVNDIGDDARTEAKAFRLVQASFGKIKAAASNPSPAGDLALIFNFMKVLDPGSTVREGEFASAQASGSVPQRVRALYNNILKGTRLSAPQRDDFLRQAQRLFNSEAELQQTRNQKVLQRAKNSGLPEGFIDPFLFDADLLDILPGEFVSEPPADNVPNLVPGESEGTF